MGRRSLVGAGGALVPAQPPQQIRSGGVEGVVTVEFQLLHQPQRDGRALDLPDRNGRG